MQALGRRSENSNNSDNFVPDHDATMNNFSVKDQFCNTDTGNWHETVFMGSANCRESFWGKAVRLTFTRDGCVDGFALKECTFQPCGRDSSDKFVHPHLAAG